MGGELKIRSSSFTIILDEYTLVEFEMRDGIRSKDSTVNYGKTRFFVNNRPEILIY